MEICRWTSLIYAEYCYFFSSGKVEPLGDIKNICPGRSMYMYTIPSSYRQRIKWRKAINEMGGNIPGGNFLGGDLPGGIFLES